MGRFIQEKSWSDRIRDIYYSISDMPLMNKLYVGFFILLVLAIAVGTQLLDK